MRQKIDIADVETATKIRAKYLRALENEEFGLLPGNTFVKTFLRTYAEYLGLDPQLLLEEYRASYEPRGEELQPYSVAARRSQRDQGRQPRRRRAPSGPPGPGTAIVVLVGVVLAIFAILGLTSDGGSDEKAPAGTNADQQPQPKKPSEPRKKDKPAVTQVRLRAAPVEPTYMCVDRGPGQEPIYVGTTAEPQTFRGKRVRINAGRSSLRLTVNGKRVDVPPSSVPVGYDFVLRDGKVTTEELPSGERPCA
jgi:hypothetical protein